MKVMPLSIQPEILKRGSGVGEGVGSAAEAILTRIVALKSWTICFIILIALLESVESQDVYARLARKPTVAHQKKGDAARAAIIAVGQAG